VSKAITGLPDELFLAVLIKKGGIEIPPLTACMGAGLFLFSSCFLGSLERVDLEVFSLDLDLDVGCVITDTVQPFLLRSRISATDLSYGTFNYTLTTFTIIDYHLTRTVREYTTLFPPESTLDAGKNRLTLHEESLL